MSADYSGCLDHVLRRIAAVRSEAKRLKAAQDRLLAEAVYLDQVASHPSVAQGRIPCLLRGCPACRSVRETMPERSLGSRDGSQAKGGGSDRVETAREAPEASQGAS